MSEFAKEHRSVKCNTRWRRQHYSVWSKLNEISAIVLVQYTMAKTKSLYPKNVGA
jgi:hypothetical protein